MAEQTFRVGEAVSPRVVFDLEVAQLLKTFDAEVERLLRGDTFYGIERPDTPPNADP